MSKTRVIILKEGFFGDSCKRFWKLKECYRQEQAEIHVVQQYQHDKVFKTCMRISVRQGIVIRMTDDEYLTLQ